MNIKELECFIATAEYGSITKAAASLYISPQGLSSLVKKIETELGVTLLERSANGVILKYILHFMKNVKCMDLFQILFSALVDIAYVINCVFKEKEYH